MIGKASLLLVMGFTVIFLIFGQNFNSVAVQAVDNYVSYYDQTCSHNLAESGANLAISNVFQKTGSTSGNFSTSDGIVSYTIQSDAVTRVITAVGTYNDISDTVQVILSQGVFSRFAYYSQTEGDIWWTGNDQVYGPFHTEDNLQVADKPTFGIKNYATTIAGKLVYKTNKKTDYPNFEGPFNDSSPDPLPSNGLQPLRTAANVNGKVFKLTSTPSLQYSDFYLTFNKDQIIYEIKGKKMVSGSWTSFDSSYTTSASTISTNGVLYLDGTDKDGNPLDMRLKGVVQGNYSVVSDGSIYLDDDITYSKDPRTVSSNDLLGIVAQKNVLISDNNNTKNIEIDAAIYCQEGGFGAENYAKRSVDGDINLYGGITQNIRQPVGTFTTTKSGKISIVSGFNKTYRYDSRLMSMFPPFFPSANGFSILSWKD